MGLTTARLRNRYRRLRLGRRGLSPLARANLAALDGLDRRAPLDECSFVVLDLETTGVDLARDGVVSAGAVRLRGGRVLLGQYFDEMILPQGEVPASSITVHGLTPQRLAAGRPLAQVFDELVGFIGADIVVAHNAGFDLHFIDRHMRAQHGLALQNLALCTLRLCRALLLPSDPFGVGRHKGQCRLDAIAERFGLDTPQRHTAIGDALVTALIFQRMLAMMEERGQARLGRLIALGQAPR